MGAISSAQERANKNANIPTNAYGKMAVAEYEQIKEGNMNYKLTHEQGSSAVDQSKNFQNTSVKTLSMDDLKDVMGNVDKSNGRRETIGNVGYTSKNQMDIGQHIDERR